MIALRLLKYIDSKDKNILIAKGFYRYPTSLKDLFNKIIILWQLQKK